jgi:hypothetical protein
VERKAAWQAERQGHIVLANCFNESLTFHIWLVLFGVLFCALNRFIMDRNTSRKTLETLPTQERISLSQAIFPKLDQSAISMVAGRILSYVLGTRDQELSYTQCLRANQWLRLHGYDVELAATNRSECN